MSDRLAELISLRDELAPRVQKLTKELKFIEVEIRELQAAAASPPVEVAPEPVVPLEVVKPRSNRPRVHNPYFDEDGIGSY